MAGRRRTRFETFEDLDVFAGIAATAGVVAGETCWVQEGYGVRKGRFSGYNDCPSDFILERLRS
jgi:hypothetical protein